VISVAEILCEALELPDGAISDGTLSGDQALADIENWDSLAVLKFMAVVDKRLGIALQSDKLIPCETIEDLATLLQQQR
jgi:acyl carrier protein